MTLLLQATIPRAVDTLVQRFAGPGAVVPGLALEAWVFEDAATRTATEARLAELGVPARLRSAYKPLLHAVLEEVELSGLTGIAIRLPAHPLAPASRFRLEAYPLAGLLRGVPVRFEEGMPARDGAPEHAVTLSHGERRSELRVLAPNRERRTPHGAAVLAPCGWLRLWRDGRLLEDGPLATEFEQAYDAVMATVVGHGWGEAMPAFEVLHLVVRTGGIEHRLAHGHETISTREALHEDLYFSVLEAFQHRAGHPPGYRLLQPGQIVPEITGTPGATEVRVSLQSSDPAAGHAEGWQVLAQATRPLDAAQLHAELAALGGEAFAARSRQGRAVPGALFAGTGPGLVVSAGQHANEASGPVGALRAAAALRAQGTGFALIPLENPDGYALHGRLRRENPRHMHHAARYTALGDDLEYRTTGPLLEKAARLEAFRRTGVRLHVNLHGYPAHEWTRPNTGYLPRGFELWTIPKGFFLILRHHPGLAAPAERFLDELARRLAAVPGLRAHNEAQLATWAAHAGALPFPARHAIPCRLDEAAEQVPPYTLVTEYPDETIGGDAFRLAHEVQMHAVLAAAALLGEGALGADPA